MKLSKVSLVAALVLGGLLTFNAPAQTPATPAAPPTGASNQGAKKGRGGLAAIIDQLGLTDAAKAKLQPIVDEEATKSKELRGKTDLTAEQRTEEMTKIRTATDTKIKDSKVLTEEQLAKYKELRTAAAKKGGKKKAATN